MQQPVFLGSIIGLLVVCILLPVYSYYLRRYKPARYRGLWEMMGNIHETPQRALRYSIALSFAIIVVIALSSLPRPVQGALARLLFPFVIIFFAVTFGLRLLKAEKKVEGLEKELENLKNKQS